MSTVDDAFVREATADARELSNALVELERTPDETETIASAFRVAHTLKGNCAAAGLSDAARLAHAVEDVLDAVRRDHLELTAELVDDALAAVDDVAELVQGAGRGERPPVDADARVETLRDRLDEPADPIGSDDAPDAGATSPDPTESPDSDPPDIEFPEIPEAAQDLSAEEALDKAAVFDDIDQLMEDMDDEAEEFADLGTAGTFDSVAESDASASTPADSESTVEDTDPDPTTSPATGGDSAEEQTLDQSGHVGDVFTDIKDEVDGEGDVDELETELAEVEFGEFDDDDDVSIDELITGDLGGDDLGPDPTDASPFDTATSDDGSPAADADPAGGPEPGAGAGAEPAVNADADFDVGGSSDATPAAGSEQTPETEPADVDPMDATVEDSTGVQASDPPEPSATPRDFPEDTSAAVGPTENRSPDARPSGSEPSSGGESTPSPRAAPTDQPSAVTEASGESPLDGPAPAPGQETASVPEPRTEPSDTRPAITEATGPIAGIDPDTGPDAEEATTDTESTDVHEGDPASELDTGFQWAETASLDDDSETAVAESGSDTPTPETGADSLPGEATAADADPPPEPEPEPEADAEPPEIDPTGVSDTESVSTTDEDDGVTDVEPPDLPDLDELTEIDTDDLAGADPDVEDLPEAGNVGADLDASVDLDASLDTDERVDDGDPDTASASPPDAAEVGEPDVDLDDLNLDDIDLGDDTFGESDEDDSLTESTGGDGTGIAAGPDTGGDAGSAPELPDLGAISPSSEDDSFEGTFGDDETAAFESRFSAAFDEVEEAAEAAVASSRAALTIEESDLDGTAFGGRSMASTSSVRPGATGGVQTLSVDVKNADELLNLAERLTVSRLQLTEAIDPDDQAVEDALSTLESVASQFRTTVMDIRLMPLRRAVENLPRVVRDVARQSDVDVEFETEGTDVRLDRSVIDRVSDPLVHLVRNAVDHGIEPPDERREAGKEPTGTVRLTAERRRQEVVVEITDDGRGIDVDAVRARAVEEGDVTFEEAEALSEAEVYELLFRSGFSTAETVTETSGRGVGMDVVDRVLTELDGDVEIESTLGEGTTVRLTLPVNIAMSEVWIVESGGERYAIPADPVDGIEDASGAVRMDGEELFEAQPIGVADGGAPGGRAGPGRESESGPEVGSSAGERADEGGADDSTEPVPLIRLREAFDTPGERNEGGMVLRLRRSARNVAIHVDSVIDREEVVVKPYGELLGGVAGVSGATLRGDGRLVNVVDIESL